MRLRLWREIGILWIVHFVGSPISCSSIVMSGGERYRGVCLIVTRPRGRGGPHRPLTRRTHLNIFHHHHPAAPIHPPSRPYHLPPAPHIWPPRQFFHRPLHYPPVEAGYPGPSHLEPGYGGGDCVPPPWAPYDSWSAPFLRGGRRSARHVPAAFTKPYNNKWYDNNNDKFSGNYFSYNCDEATTKVKDEDYEYEVDGEPYDDCADELSKLSLAVCQISGAGSEQESVCRGSPPDTGTQTTHTSSCDSVSITSDEGTLDAMLPRIIKPRKRRKKDRKPSNSSTTSEESKKDVCSAKTSPTDGKSFVTLKPYVPSFYSSHDCGSDSEKSLKDDSDSRELIAAEVEDSFSEEQTISSKCLLGGPSVHACGCERCVPCHSFPTPPSSPSSASSYSSKKSDSCQSSNSSGEGDQSSSTGLCSSGSDDEFWPSTIDRPLVRSYSEPSEAYKLPRSVSDVPMTHSSNEAAGHAPATKKCPVIPCNANNSSVANKPCASTTVALPRNTNVVYRTSSASAVWCTPNLVNKYYDNGLNTLRRRHSMHSHRSSPLDLPLLHQYAGKHSSLLTFRPSSTSSIRK